jgi:hypothetical protein
MAKETAHQIGTPLSSLIGWVEILKSENVDESTTIEIEKILSDYKPLQTVSQNWLRTHIRKERHCRRDLAILYLSSIPFQKILNSLSRSKITYFRYA